MSYSPEFIALALDHSRNFASANPRLSKTTVEHIEGLCNIVESLAETARQKVANEAIDDATLRQQAARVDEDARLYSNSAEDVAQWLFANGHHDAAATVRNQLDVRNERIRALEAALSAQPAPRQHHWDRDGERCTVCGDKDWMGGSCNGPRESAQPAERQGEAVAWRYRLSTGEWRYATAKEEIRIPQPIVEAQPLYTHPAAPVGEVVVTRDATGNIVAVTRQDSEGRILRVIATAPDKAAPVGVPDGGDALDGARFRTLLARMRTGSIGFGPEEGWITAEDTAQDWRDAMDTLIAAAPSAPQGVDRG